ncbi:SDR family oxidoreductase [bacterium]|nr:SDR family oxidoreductase [bacterium]
MNQTAIVVGGTRRVGRWVSEALLVHGLEVHAIYRADRQAAERAVTELKAAGCQLQTYQADATDYAALAAAVDGIVAQAGPVGVLVNCLGDGAAGALVETPSDAFEHLWRSNVLAVHNAVLAVVPAMQERGGRIVNFLSVSADTHRAFRAVPAYAACKAMLASYSRSLARELAPVNITVNCISPGATALPAENVPAVPEDKLPNRMYVGPEDLAGALWYLLSPSAEQVTGTVLNLSGGWAL